MLTRKVIFVGPEVRSNRERRAVWWRVLLAGPGAILVSLLVLLGMPLWFPPGVGNVDHLVMPIFTFPLVWAVLFFHACLDRRLSRVAVVAFLVAVANVALLFWKFAGPISQS